MIELQTPDLPSDQTCKRTCILVLGMHRSGTSAITRVLSMLGAALPRNVIGVADGNELGHWEPAKLAILHDQILADLHSAWFDWTSLDFTQLPAKHRLQIAADINELVENEYRDAELFVIKEPRIGRFPSFFIDAVSKPDISFVAIIALRNPLDVIDSLMARNGLWPSDYNRQDAALLWLTHMLESERAARTMQHAVVSYEALIDNPIAAIDRTLAAAGLKTPISCSEATGDICAYINNDLRHHARRPEDVLLDPQVNGWVSDTYIALRDIELNRNLTGARTTLDRVRSEFLSAMPILRTFAIERRMALATALKVGSEAEQAALNIVEMTQQRDAVLENTSVALADAEARVEATKAQMPVELEALTSRLTLEAETAQAELSALIDAERARADTANNYANSFEARFVQAQAEIADTEARLEVTKAQMQAKVDILMSKEAATAKAIDDEKCSKALQLEALKLSHAADLSGEKNKLNQTQEFNQHLRKIVAAKETERLSLITEVQQLKNSRSWNITSPLRIASTLYLNSKFYNINKIIRKKLNNIYKYNTFKSKQTVDIIGSDTDAKLRSGVLIITPPHTLHYANIMSQEFLKYGFKPIISDNFSNALEYEHIVVFCPNIYETLPDNYIAVQMEQNVSTKWFNNNYIDKLSSARAIIDYSIDNISFLTGLGLSFNRLFYIPVPSFLNLENLNAPSNNESIDVLFYGDANNPRRRMILDRLKEHFAIIEINNTFGSELWDALRRSKLVLNLHYYDNAILETVRLSECLSFGVPVVSESVNDKNAMADFESAVSFAKLGDIDDIASNISKILNAPEQRDILSAHATKLAGHRYAVFAQHFCRFLLAQNMIGNEYATSALELPSSSKQLCLTLPETPNRTQAFLRQEPDGFELVSGLRRSPGWKGCAQSYQTIMQKVASQGLETITIVEDDVVFPSEYHTRKAVIDEYLLTNSDKWDVFSGFMVNISDNTNIVKIEEINGVKFIWLDKMISTVFNIYNKKAINLISRWDISDVDVNSNTIDRYLESYELKVIITFPFLVDHDENQSSSIWGFDNTQYLQMLTQSNKKLELMVKKFERQ